MRKDRLIKKILRGQAELDRMKFEIKHMVQLFVLALLTTDEIHAQMQAGMLFVRTEPSGNAWCLEKSGENCFDINYLIRTYADRCEVEYTSKVHIMQPPALGSVKRVWEGLPVLISGLEDMFPQLRERIKPFLEAAETHD